jgi:hypothetical protein
MTVSSSLMSTASSSQVDFHGRCGGGASEAMLDSALTAARGYPTRLTARHRGGRSTGAHAMRRRANGSMHCDPRTSRQCFDSAPYSQFRPRRSRLPCEDRSSQQSWTIDQSLAARRRDNASMRRDRPRSRGEAGTGLSPRRVRAFCSEARRHWRHVRSLGFL